MGANNSRVKELGTGCSPSILPELQNFFRQVRDLDRSSIREREKLIWDFVIFYIEWLEHLESPSPFGPEVLDSQFQIWRKNTRDEYGSMPRRKFEIHVDYEIKKITVRLEGNDAEPICFSLMRAVAEAFKEEKFPPKFEYKHIEKRWNDFAPPQVKSALFEIRHTEKIASYRALHAEMTALFTSMKFSEERWKVVWGSSLRDAIVEYLGWIVAPCNCDKVKAIHRSFQFKILGRRPEIDEERYKSILEQEAKELKDRIEAQKDYKHRIEALELVDTVVQFLKEGNLPPSAQMLASQLQQPPPPPPAYDTIILESKPSSQFFGKTDASGRILKITEDLDQEISTLMKLQQQILVDDKAETLLFSGQLADQVMALGQQRKVLEEAMRSLSGLLGQVKEIGCEKTQAVDNIE